jgi:hypothetical protein
MCEWQDWLCQVPNPRGHQPRQGCHENILLVVVVTVESFWLFHSFAMCVAMAQEEDKKVVVAITRAAYVEAHEKIKQLNDKISEIEAAHRNKTIGGGDAYSSLKRLHEERDTHERLVRPYIIPPLVGDVVYCRQHRRTYNTSKRRGFMGTLSDDCLCPNINLPGARNSDTCAAFVAKINRHVDAYNAIVHPPTACVAVFIEPYNLGHRLLTRNADGVYL